MDINPNYKSFAEVAPKLLDPRLKQLFQDYLAVSLDRPLTITYWFNTDVFSVELAPGCEYTLNVKSEYTTKLREYSKTHAGEYDTDGVALELSDWGL